MIQASMLVIEARVIIKDSQCRSFVFGYFNYLLTPDFAKATADSA